MGPNPKPPIPNPQSPIPMCLPRYIKELNNEIIFK